MFLVYDDWRPRLGLLLWIGMRITTTSAWSSHAVTLRPRYRPKPLAEGNVGRSSFSPYSGIVVSWPQKQHSDNVEPEAFFVKNATTNSVDGGSDDSDYPSASILLPEKASPGWRRRMRAALPGAAPLVQTQNKDDDEDDDKSSHLDRLILNTAVPSIINLAVVPLINAVDTFWVGRLGVALALAGQAAANQAFFTVYFLVAFLPTLTAPLVAAAAGSGDTTQARQRINESLFLCNVLGLLGTVLLVGFPRQALGWVLPPGAPAFDYATPYLRWRGLSMMPALVAATGFAAFRGLLDTVTPLKVSLATNLLNLVADPILIFGTPLRVVGAALATAASETAGGFVYLRLLLRRRLVTWRGMVTPPAWESLWPLLQGGLSVLGRQLALNIGILAAARKAQALDVTAGVAAAAYGIVMQMYSVGIVVHVAMQGTAAALVPSTLAQRGTTAARQVADRMFVWNTLVGLGLGVTQVLALPILVPLFSPLPAVQQAVRGPALLSSVLHVLNGPVFAGEGVLLGLSSFRDLMLITAVGIAIMVACLKSPLARGLEGILGSFLVFTVVQAVAVVWHYLKIGPLAVGKNSTTVK